MPYSKIEIEVRETNNIVNDNNNNNNNEQKECNDVLITTQIINDCLIDFAPNLEYMLCPNVILGDVYNNNNNDNDIIIYDKFIFAFINQSVAADCENGRVLSAIIIDQNNTYKL